MIEPWYIAVEPFDPRAEEKWTGYIEWSGLKQLTELVSFDGCLCPAVIRELMAEDWRHNVNEDYVLFFFRDLDYLLRRVAGIQRVNILAAIRNPDSECSDALPDDRFEFKGYDVVDVCADVSALTDCGGFPLAFRNEELSSSGLISTLARAREIQAALRGNYPDEHHANCNVWALWKMKSPHGQSAD